MTVLHSDEPHNSSESTELGVEVDGMKDHDDTGQRNGSDDGDRDEEWDAIALVMDDAREDAIYMFRYALVFTAVLESFAHGANDTANSTAAFTAVYTGECYGETLPAQPRPLLILGMICDFRRI